MTRECVPWEVSRSHWFRHQEHVNIQELQEVRLELVQRAQESLAAQRFVNGTDSRVGLGCVAKGRSAAFRLSGILRRMLGWFVLGRKSISQFWLPSKMNPSDEPSRFVDLRASRVPSAEERLLLKAVHTPVAPGRAGGHRVCLEVFGGVGRLTRWL